MDILSAMDYHERSYQSLCRAIAILSEKFVNLGLPLYRPFEYDLLAEHEGGHISKVKIITSTAKAPSGAYVVNLRKNSYSKEKDHLNSELYDILVVDTPDGVYLIPSKLITNKRAISLSMFENYKIDPS